MIARAPLEIPLKVGLHLEHLADVSHGQRLALVDSERLRRAHRVLDLPPIELVPRQGRIIILAERHEAGLVKHPHALDENLENGLLGSEIQRIVP